MDISGNSTNNTHNGNTRILGDLEVDGNITVDNALGQSEYLDSGEYKSVISNISGITNVTFDSFTRTYYEKQGNLVKLYTTLKITFTSVLASSFQFRITVPALDIFEKKINGAYCNASGSFINQYDCDSFASVINVDGTINVIYQRLPTSNVNLPFGGDAYASLTIVYKLEGDDVPATVLLAGGSGSGDVKNPMLETLNGGGFNIVNVDSIVANSITAPNVVTNPLSVNLNANTKNITNINSVDATTLNATNTNTTNIFVDTIATITAPDVSLSNNIDMKNLSIKNVNNTKSTSINTNDITAITPATTINMNNDIDMKGHDILYPTTIIGMSDIKNEVGQLRVSGAPLVLKNQTLGTSILVDNDFNMQNNDILNVPEIKTVGQQLRLIGGPLHLENDSSLTDILVSNNFDMNGKDIKDVNNITSISGDFKTTNTRGVINYAKNDTDPLVDIGEMAAYLHTMGLTSGGALSKFTPAVTSDEKRTIVITDAIGFTMLAVPQATHAITELNIPGSNQIIPANSDVYLYYDRYGVFQTSTALPSNRTNLILGRVITTDETIYIEDSRLNAHHWGNYIDTSLRNAFGAVVSSGGLIVENTFNALQLDITQCDYYYSTSALRLDTKQQIVFDTYYRDVNEPFFFKRTPATTPSLVPNYYDDGSNAIIPIPSGSYAKHLLIGIDTRDGLNLYLLIYAQQTYVNQLDAELAPLPAKPSFCVNTFINIASLVVGVAGMTTTLVTILDERPRNGFATSAVSQVNITNHSQLNNLGNDDHTQYLLVDGTRPMAGDLDMDFTYSINNINSITAFNTMTFDSNTSYDFKNYVDFTTKRFNTIKYIRNEADFQTPTTLSGIYVIIGDVTVTQKLTITGQTTIKGYNSLSKLIFNIPGLGGGDFCLINVGNSAQNLYIEDIEINKVSSAGLGVALFADNFKTRTFRLNNVLFKDCNARYCLRVVGWKLAEVLNNTFVNITGGVASAMVNLDDCVYTLMESNEFIENVFASPCINILGICNYININNNIITISGASSVGLKVDNSAVITRIIITDNIFNAVGGALTANLLQVDTSIQKGTICNDNTNVDPCNAALEGLVNGNTTFTSTVAGLWVPIDLTGFAVGTISRFAPTLNPYEFAYDGKDPIRCLINVNCQADHSTGGIDTVQLGISQNGTVNVFVQAELSSGQASQVALTTVVTANFGDTFQLVCKNITAGTNASGFRAQSLNASLVEV